MSQSDQTICDECKRHGPDLEKRLTLHRDWWMEFATRQREAHAHQKGLLRFEISNLEDRVGELNTRISDLDDVVMERFESNLGDVRAHLESAVTMRADARVSAAYRIRDRAMAVLWKIDRLHGDGRNRDTCRCGKPVTQCKERGAFDPILDEFDKWEERNIELAKADRQHGLPPEHPEVQKRRPRYARY